MINKFAFRPPSPSYRKQDVTHWVQSDTGTRVPLVHIDFGFPLTLLVSHGNGEDLGDCVRVWYKIAKMAKVNLVCYEYSGYGFASGKPSEDELYSNARAALRLIVETLKLPPSKIVLVGKSIGSCAACHLASRGTTFRGLILVGALASGARVILPMNVLLDGAAFDNLSKLKQNSTPVQIIHGLDDPLVRLGCARDIHRVCADVHPLPPVFIADGGHEPERTKLTEVGQAIAAFILHISSTVYVPKARPDSNSQSNGKVTRSASWDRKHRAPSEPVVRAMSAVETPSGIARPSQSPHEAQEDSFLIQVTRALSFERKPRCAREERSSSKEGERKLPGKSDHSAETQEDDSVWRQVTRALSWDRRPPVSVNSERRTAQTLQIQSEQRSFPGPTSTADSSPNCSDPVRQQVRELTRALSWKRKPATRTNGASAAHQTQAPSGSSCKAENGENVSKNARSSASVDQQEGNSILHQVTRALSWDRKPGARPARG
ncbi:hypothetical protein AB1Y20_000489 [Prymnesium parvum]